MDGLQRLHETIIACRKCPRLARWREQVAKDPPLRYRGEPYWAKPLPGFGDSNARLLIVGLAPAAHGGNRTGRIFTGDKSGDWLYAALYDFGFANQPTSQRRDDGLRLKDSYVTAAVRCAPPANKPTLQEFRRCRPYLVQELRLLKHVRVVIALGKIAFDSFLKAYEETGGTVVKPRPLFGHGQSVRLSQNLTLLCSYHPSQQNTFTGKLTKPMFQAVFEKAKGVLSAEEQDRRKQ
jgi:uracil-DNA glycosylase family 4